MNVNRITEIEIDGEVYKKCGKDWVDCYYCLVNAVILNQIYEKIAGQLRLSELSHDELVSLAGQLIDSDRMSPLAVKIYEQIFEKTNLPAFSYEYLNDLARSLKNLKLYSQAITVVTYLLDHIDQFCEEWKRKIALQGLYAVLMSCLRGKGDPQEAIIIYSKLFYKYGDGFLTSMICTSAAAAYCDLKNYEKALKMCDKAYALQGGGTGELNELSLVYKRLEKETGMSIPELRRYLEHKHENGY